MISPATVHVLGIVGGGKLLHARRCGKILIHFQFIKTVALFIVVCGSSRLYTTTVIVVIKKCIHSPYPFPGPEETAKRCFTGFDTFLEDISVILL